MIKSKVASISSGHGVVFVERVLDITRFYVHSVGCQCTRSVAV